MWSEDIPGWITDKNFQDIIIAPMFDIMYLTFSGYCSKHFKNADFNDYYRKKVEFYLGLFDKYEQYL